MTDEAVLLATNHTDEHATDYFHGPALKALGDGKVGGEKAAQQPTATDEETRRARLEALRKKKAGK